MRKKGSFRFPTSGRTATGGEGPASPGGGGSQFLDSNAYMHPEDRHNSSTDGDFAGGGLYSYEVVFDGGQYFVGV